MAVVAPPSLVDRIRERYMDDDDEEGGDVMIQSFVSRHLNLNSRQIWKFVNPCQNSTGNASFHIQVNTECFW